jgi:hypothetical protein
MPSNLAADVHRENVPTNKQPICLTIEPANSVEQIPLEKTAGVQPLKKFQHFMQPADLLLSKTIQ